MLKKQVLELVKIFKELKDENIELELKIVGDGPEFSRISRYIVNNNLKKNIVLLGLRNKKQISNILDNTDYLMSCSKVETFGITITSQLQRESQIVLNSGGPNDFINNNNSYLVESFIDLKNKIKNIVKNPKNLIEVK